MENDDLVARLREELELASMRVREHWDRDLPLGELLADRWDRAKSLGFGEGSSIYASSYVFGTPSVGRNVWIGPFTLIDATGGLTIGDECTVSAGVQIYSHDTVRRTLTGRDAAVERAAVAIGTRVYVGPQCVISKGVTVGEMSVIGAMSFVNRDIAPNTIAVGSPARSVGKVTLAADGDVELVFD